MEEKEFEKYCETLRQESNDTYGFKPVAENNAEDIIAMRKKFREQGWGTENSSNTPELSDGEVSKLKNKINQSMMYN